MPDEDIMVNDPEVISAPAKLPLPTCDSCIRRSSAERGSPAAPVLHASSLAAQWVLATLPCIQGIAVT